MLSEEKFLYLCCGEAIVPRLSAHRIIKKKYKISLALFPLDGNFCFPHFYLSLWPSARPRVWSPVATIHSALHKPMISLPFFPLKRLAPSLSSALPFSFFLFFSLLLSPFSLAHFLPFIASGACGLRSLGLSL